MFRATKTVSRPGDVSVSTVGEGPAWELLSPVSPPPHPITIRAIPMAPSERRAIRTSFGERTERHLTRMGAGSYQSQRRPRDQVTPLGSRSGLMPAQPNPNADLSAGKGEQRSYQGKRYKTVCQNREVGVASAGLPLRAACR